MADIMMYNVIILGFAFMFVFTAFQTTSGIEETVIESVQHDSSNSTRQEFEGSGYYSLAIIYGVFAFSNWLAPSVVSLIGPRATMFISGAVYTGFIAIFLSLKIWSLYMMSVFLGIAAALIWTAQGNFLTINSTSETMGRNSGIFWAMLQCSLLFGNIFIYFEIGKTSATYITKTTRMTIFLVLTSVSGIGVLIFLLLRKVPPRDESSIQSTEQSPDTDVRLGPVQSLVRSFQLLKMKAMLLLMVCFFYTGLELTYFSGVYGTCVGNTHLFGVKSKSYVALCGILIGCGEILGGAIFGLMGRNQQISRDPIVLLGFIVHIIAFYLSLVNLPSGSPISDTFNQEGYIQPNLALALVTAFLLGFGDACFNTQVYSILGYLFPNDSAPAFALFKFTQSLSAAIAFFYAKHLLLHWQLLILVVFAVLGTMSFAVVEWTASRRVREGYEKI
ncbi:LOW QUALITY PROTEIN: UNC93-like protein MFSD11 [Patiria miniata]|uniref:UNC93-like protein MFSD11 n=1 Tax=Patiria miniata TaxID=46514 RepID=A0A913ZC93_PATMI|nr:LOW QUALITY PROTEIN: UNC93-like protein MFSD11 [Patiria miniata]